MNRTKQIDAAQRKVDAIDRRIDAVRGELFRRAGVNFDAFDLDTQEGGLAACIAVGNARRDIPGYDGIEHSLFVRRSHASAIRDKLMAREALEAERRDARELRRKFEADCHACPDCGHVHFACAA